MTTTELQAPELDQRYNLTTSEKISFTITFKGINSIHLDKSIATLPLKNNVK